MAYEDTFRSIKIKSGRVALLPSQFCMALPGTVAEFGFPFNAEVKTEQAAGFAKVYDLSAAEYQPLATSATGGGYAANYQIFPGADAVGDFAVFGAASPFGVMWFDMDTGATYAGDAITWQYWNGTAWATLTILWDDTNTTPAAGGKRPFMQDGFILFSAPSDWVASTIDSQAAYWVRAYVNAAQVTNTPVTDSHEHYIITDPHGTKTPATGKITTGRFTFITTSGSTDDADIILCNLTDGTCSTIKVITKAKPQGVTITFDQMVTADDVLAIYVTDEDGTTEYANGMVEFTIQRT